MEKLELKHIVGYLPYGLQIKCGNITRATLTLDTVTSELISVKEILINNAFKPILRPLSDLTKEIDDIVIYNSLSRRSKNDFDTLCPSVLKWSYEDVEILLKHHFDIHDLIGKGLAIDLNTINNGIQ